MDRILLEYKSHNNISFIEDNHLDNGLRFDFKYIAAKRPEEKNTFKEKY